MRVNELAAEIAALEATGDLHSEAIDVTHDSRACQPGTVFVAIRGDKFDAHNFIPQAVAQGAVAVISEQRAQANAPAWLRVENARAALAQAAAAVYGHPSRQLKVVGITGTNGKTTTAHLVDSIIRTAEGIPT